MGGGSAREAEARGAGDSSNSAGRFGRSCKAPLREVVFEHQKGEEVGKKLLYHGSWSSELLRFKVLRVPLCRKRKKGQTTCARSGCVHYGKVPNMNELARALTPRRGMSDPCITCV
eukprot:scaffold182509_cov16-Tisochrysis_lutea.AAC.1